KNILKRLNGPVRRYWKWRISGIRSRLDSPGSTSLQSSILCDFPSPDKLAGRLIRIVRRHKPSSHGKFENSLLQRLYAGVGVEEGVEVAFQSRPLAGEIGGVGGVYQRGEQRFDQSLMSLQR